MGNESSFEQYEQSHAKIDGSNEQEVEMKCDSFHVPSLKARKGIRAFHRVTEKVIQQNRQKRFSVENSPEDRMRVTIQVLKTRPRMRRVNGQRVLQEAAARRMRKKIHMELAQEEAPWSGRTTPSQQQPRAILLHGKDRPKGPQKASLDKECLEECKPKIVPNISPPSWKDSPKSQKNKNNQNMIQVREKPPPSSLFLNSLKQKEREMEIKASSRSSREKQYVQMPVDYKTSGAGQNSASFQWENKP